MRSSIQRALLASLSGILKPIIRLTLNCGVSYPEFDAIVRSTFVNVARQDYGIRGRPTNSSRVAVMTGLSRKEIRRLQEDSSSESWTPDREASPVNVVLHYWHFDPDFCDEPGSPRPLEFDGPKSFSLLTQRYAGDVPPGAMRTELRRAGAISEDQGGRMSVEHRYFGPSSFHEDFLRNVAFSLSSLADTVVHNSMLASELDFSTERNEARGRFERFAWTKRLTPNDQDAFRRWARFEGAKFIEHVDTWIGEHEVPRHEWEHTAANACGIGVYYFERDE